MSRRVSRRRLLASGALALVGGLAGCNGTGGAGGPESATDAATETAATTGTATDTATPEPAGCRITNATGDVDPIPVSVDGSVDDDAERTVAVRWNARAQPSMAAADSEYVQYTATRGQAYVVFRLELSNATDREIRVAPYDLFGVRLAAGDLAWFEEVTLFGLDAVFEPGFDLPPDESRSAVLPFEVPRGLDAVTLIRYADRDERVEETFTATCDRSLAIGVDPASE